MFAIVQPLQAETAPVPVRALSWMESSELARCLTTEIIARGGWILSSVSARKGELTMLFEFQCDAALEMYVALMTCGLSVNKGGHMELTRLWLCANHRGPDSCLRLAQIELTAIAAGGEQVRASCAS